VTRRSLATGVPGRQDAPGGDGQLVAIALDSTIMISHSEKQEASPIWRKTFGFLPMTAFADHGQEGNWEPLAILLRPVERGPEHRRRPPRDNGAGAAALSTTAQGGRPDRFRRRHARVPGMADLEILSVALLHRHEHHLGHAGRNPRSPGGTPAYEGDGRAGRAPGRRRHRPPAPGRIGLRAWRVTVRKERPHPGAALSPTWNWVIAPAAAAKTGSVTPRTPGSATRHGSPTWRWIRTAWSACGKQPGAGRTRIVRVSWRPCPLSSVTWAQPFGYRSRLNIGE
jgi:hypothetical protein